MFIKFVIFMQGIQLCTSIKNTITTFTNLHSTLEKPLIKSNGILICILLETMKNISYIYQKNHIKMDKLLTDIIQYFEYLCLSIITEVKVRMFLSTIYVLMFYPYNVYKYNIYKII